MANIDKSAIDVAGARQMAFETSLVKDAFRRVPGSIRLINIINMDIASENMATYLGCDLKLLSCPVGLRLLGNDVLNNRDFL